MNQNPDFSASGASFFFGFALDLSFSGTIPSPPGFLNRGFNVDDIEIVVTTGTTSIPSSTPATLGLLVALLAGAGLLAMRRAQS
jgi:hypothetical protein